MINCEGCARKGIQCKNSGMAEVGTPISLDGVALYPNCWCVCYLHFAPENPEDGGKGRGGIKAVKKIHLADICTL